MSETKATSFNRVKTFLIQLTQGSGNAITPIFTNTPPPDISRIISLNTFVKNFKAHARMGSLPPVKLPNFQLEDSETDKLYKTLDIEWGSNRKQLNLFIANNGTNWCQVGAISLLNPAGYPYRIYNLLDLFTANLAIELGDNGMIGVQVVDVGYGLLQFDDVVTIHGSYVQEIIVDSLNLPITTVVDFEELVDVESTLILPANLSRKYLAITNNGDYPIYLNLGSTAAAGRGIYLTPAGSFDSDKPYFGAVSAIAVGDISSVSGIDCS